MNASENIDDLSEFAFCSDAEVAEFLATEDNEEIKSASQILPRIGKVIPHAMEEISGALRSLHPGEIPKYLFRGTPDLEPFSPVRLGSTLHNKSNFVYGSPFPQVASFFGRYFPRTDELGNDVLTPSNPEAHRAFRYRNNLIGIYKNHPDQRYFGPEEIGPALLRSKASQRPFDRFGMDFSTARNLSIEKGKNFTDHMFETPLTPEKNPFLGWGIFDPSRNEIRKLSDAQLNTVKSHILSIQDYFGTRTGELAANSASRIGDPKAMMGVSDAGDYVKKIRQYNPRLREAVSDFVKGFPGFGPIKLACASIADPFFKSALAITPSAIDSAYAGYKNQPTPENLSTVVKALDPTIHWALSQTKSLEDPVVRGKAQLFAAHAVETYDPERAGGANLATHVGWQLKQLSRSARESRSAVHIPERAQLDAYKLSQASKEFEDTHGREPDTLELADHTGMSTKRIEKVRKFQMAIPSEGNAGDAFQEESPDYDSEAMDYVYHDCDHTDRRILELKTGYKGSPVLTPREIAVKLRLTPTQLTRRSMRLTKRINEIVEQLPKV